MTITTKNLNNTIEQSSIKEMTQPEVNALIWEQLREMKQDIKSLTRWQYLVIGLCASVGFDRILGLIVPH